MRRCLIYFFLLMHGCIQLVFSQNYRIYDRNGAWVRSDTNQRHIYLMFTLHEYDEGLDHILDVLNSFEVKASFFLTGQYVSRNPYKVLKIKKEGHYIAGHSDKHLLYCDWAKPDSLLYSLSDIWKDYKKNYRKLRKLGIKNLDFCPPYEWCNQEIVDFFKSKNISLINMTPHSITNADYTTPEMPNYKTSEQLMNKLKTLIDSENINGYHFLIHPGTDPKRTDKFYEYLAELLNYIKNNNYALKSFNEDSLN